MQEKPSDFLKLAVRLAKQSAGLLEKMQPRSHIKVNKGGGDFALDADIESEKLILAGIRKHYPTHDILTEESKHKHVTSNYLWVIDPLEGTLNYAHKLPLWGVNVAVFQNGEPIVGVFYAPKLKELYHAAKGKGAFLNGKRIKVSKEANIMRSFFGGTAKHLASLNLSGHLLRNLGCCCLELAYVARGLFGARIKLRGTDSYGYGAGSILVTEAGGTITDTRGKPWKLNSDGAIASNGKLHPEILALLNNTS